MTQYLHHSMRKRLLYKATITLFEYRRIFIIQRHTNSKPDAVRLLASPKNSYRRQVCHTSNCQIENHFI
jgi:hypothetical protein